MLLVTQGLQGLLGRRDRKGLKELRARTALQATAISPLDIVDVQVDSTAATLQLISATVAGA